MLFRFILLIIGIIFLLFVIILMVQQNNTENNERIQQPSVTPQASEEHLDTFVWVPYWDQEQAIQSIQNNPDSIDGIGLFWYKLTPDGQIDLYQDAQEDYRIIEYAHSQGIEVYGLIANLRDEGEDTDDWDSNRVEQVITNTERREQHIEDLVNLVLYKNFDGLALDYESLDADLRDDYSQFVEELSQALHNEGKSLEIAIHPKNSDDPETQYFGAISQDYERLATHADRLHFMMYTEHDITASPGPPSTIEWSESVLNYATQEANVPPNKIVLGIGLFGTHWVTDESNERRISGTTADLTYRALEQIASENQHELVRDENTQSMMMTFVDQDGYNIIWFNDAKSLMRRMELAREYGLSGISLWRLGGEDPDIWEEL